MGSTGMIECPVADPTLPELFDPHIPNHPALWAVLLGRHAGRALVDDRVHPSQCVLRTDAYLTYASSGVRKDFLAAAIHEHRRAGQVWLVRSKADDEAPKCNRIFPRIEFYDYDPHSRIFVEFRNHLPQGYELRRIDRTLLERCEWRNDMAFYCGSQENFLQNGLGVCLMRGEEIIVEAYASAFGSRYAEIGAITHEPFRGRGYAPLTVTHLLKLLEERGYHGYWSCDQDNPASARVARKLGFMVVKPYSIWEYEQQSEA
jgi:RimJ/RimL family protein N-acetyltransferase